MLTQGKPRFILIWNYSLVGVPKPLIYHRQGNQESIELNLQPNDVLHNIKPVRPQCLWQRRSSPHKINVAGPSYGVVVRARRAGIE